MNVLVTGGAGFIGQHVVKRLMDIGDYVVVYDLFDSQAHSGIVKSDYPGDYTYIADVCDKATLYEAIEDNEVDTIIHLASQVGAGQSMYDIENYVYHNDVGTAALMEVATRLGGIKRIVLASSRAVYGEGPYHCVRCKKTVHPDQRTTEQLRSGLWNCLCPECFLPVSPLPMTEYSLTKPTNIYAASKLAQENIVKILSRAHEIEYTILRLFNVYGPGQSVNNPYTGIVSIFMNWALQGKKPVVYEDGRMLKDFVYVEDVAKAFVTALAPCVPNMGTFNIGTGVATSLGDAARLVQTTVGNSDSIEINKQFRVGDARHGHAYTENAGIFLGWRARTSLEDGLVKLRDWAKEQDLLDIQEDEKLVDRGLSR